MMGSEMVPETLLMFNQLIWLATKEDLLKCICLETFISHAVQIGLAEAMKIETTYSCDAVSSASFSLHLHYRQMGKVDRRSMCNII
jgi:hypothetical protein